MFFQWFVLRLCFIRCTTTQTFQLNNLIYNCDAISIISAARGIMVSTHNEVVDLNHSNIPTQTSFCANVMTEDVIRIDQLNPIKYDYGPVWGRYVYIYVRGKSLPPLCEIEIYKESGMSMYSFVICLPEIKTVGRVVGIFSVCLSIVLFSIRS